MNSLNLPYKYVGIYLLVDEIEKSKIYAINKNLLKKVDICGLEYIDDAILNYFVLLNSQRINFISKYMNLYYYTNFSPRAVPLFRGLLLKPITAEKFKEKLDNYLLKLYSLSDITDEFLKALNSLDFTKIKSEIKEIYLQNGRHLIEWEVFKDIFQRQIPDENYKWLLDFVLNDTWYLSENEAVFDEKIVPIINNKAKELQIENEKFKALCENLQNPNTPSKDTSSNDIFTKEFLYSIKFSIICHEIFCDLILQYYPFFKNLLVDQKYISINHEKDKFIILEFFKKALQNSINLSLYLQSDRNNDDEIKQIAFCGFEMPEFKEKSDIGSILYGGYISYYSHNSFELNEIIKMCRKLRPKGIEILRDFINKIEKFEVEQMII
ncbi:MULTISPECIES: hypothetical protein [unclassified Campylobacter]|uniref:hypothetical protein n=2 Tax=Campylobacter TaxID=194 RepID=UPI0022E9B779|nr:MULTISPECIES: hypothetical protein [unclassified Campylobacter]MDA3054159.1 hypothetical protein [Campylobacter sp. VBCF_07 NA4]MDA3060850.1 hypothetical protein [Campylobacter sp. VBCF_02 NA5]MDA3070363.1 hypothetical protein [Campylobacter sp. VBCF_08 NA3]WBR53674.1 hypothetical protein PF027_04905 [Campylobacter sp. VBCF_01 NA2]